MPDIFHMPPEQWALSILCGLLVGMAKTGIGGAGMLAIPIFAGIFGGKPSVGLILPMLCLADIFGVSYYNRHAEWSHIRRLKPWTVSGIAAGLFVGSMISDILFRDVLAVIVIVSIAILVWQELRHGEIAVPDNFWFKPLIGFSGGFATMIGNAAGPVMTLYFLSMRLPKNSFIGTRAWFFMIVNFLKVPLHIFFWHTITVQTLTFNMSMLPAIALGALLGIWIVKKIPEKPYRIFIMVITTLAAIKLFF